MEQAGGRLLKNIMSTALVGLVSIGLLGGFALVVRMTDLKDENGSLRKDLIGTKERVGRLERMVADILSAQNEVQTGPAGELRNRVSRIPFTLTDGEIQLIRQFIKVPPSYAGVGQKFNVGDSVPNSVSTAFPEPLVDKLPKLRNTRFMIDRNGAIVILEAGGNRVNIVLSPTN